MINSLSTSTSEQALAKDPACLNKTYRILSLDGGGIRGIGTLVMLAELESRTGKKVQDLYDAFIGTSTGGIIAACFAKGISANKLLDLYYTEGDKIFTISWRHSAKTLGGLAGPRYEAKNVKVLARTILKDDTVATVLKPFAVTTCDTVKGFKLLTSHSDCHTLNPKMANKALYKLIRATSAAPTYFKGTKFNGRICIDGGVSANDPVLHAFNYGAKLFGKQAHIRVDSFGTGELVQEAKGQNALDQSAGKFGAAAKLAQVFIGGATSAIHAAMKPLFKEKKYRRYQFYLNEDVDLADVSKKDILMQQAYLACHTQAFKDLIHEMRC